jgi:hypothetical protein
MKIISLLTASFLLSSCMHLGMMGTHGGDGSSQHQSVSASTLEKEVTSGNVKAIATYPPLQIGKQTTFAIKLEDKTTGKPISNARVSFHTAYLHIGEKRQMSGMQMMHGQMDTSHAQSAPDHDVNVDQEVLEGSTAGVYSIGFTPSQAGEHKLMFHVSAPAEQALPQELIVETTRNVSAFDESHGGGMMGGMGGASDYFIIGAAIMGVMMILVWATGGRIF